MSRVGRGLVAGVALTVLSAGCGIARVEQAPRDDYSTWSSTPLAPDARLSATAADPGGSCTAGPNGEPVRLLLQDRRTDLTAAFIFRGETTFGSCLVTQGASSGGSGPLPEAMTSALSIDVDGFGDVAGGVVHELGGRVAADVTEVTIALDDGRNLTASVGGGHWLAWWPGDVRAATITGMDAAGQVVVEQEIPA